jgi:hypothetical protein
MEVCTLFSLLRFILASSNDLKPQTTSGYRNARHIWLDELM